MRVIRLSPGGNPSAPCYAQSRQEHDEYPLWHLGTFSRTAYQFTQGFLRCDAATGPVGYIPKSGNCPLLAPTYNAIQSP